MQFTAEIMVKQSLHHYYQIQEIYMSDFRGFISDILFFLRNHIDFVKMKFILFKLYFMLLILTLILYNSVFQHKIAQSVM